MTFLLVLISSLLNASAQVLLKKGVGNLPPLAFTFSWVFEFLTNSQLMGGIAFYGLSLGVWLTALGRGELGYLVPLLSLSYVFTAFAGIVWFGESFSTLRWMGIAMILLGVYCVART